MVALYGCAAQVFKYPSILEYSDALSNHHNHGSLTSSIPSISAVENVILFWAFYSILRTPFRQIDAFEFEVIFNVILVWRAPMSRFRKPSLGSRVFRSWQENNLVEEVIYGFMVVLREPGGEFIGIFAIAINITRTQLEALQIIGVPTNLLLAENCNPVVVVKFPFSRYRCSKSNPSSVGNRGRNSAVPVNFPDGYESILLVISRSSFQSP